MPFQVLAPFCCFARLLILRSGVALFLIASSVASHAEQPIIWASSSAPEEPVYGHFTNIQLGFNLQRLIFAHLPDYNIQYRPQNNARVFQEMQREPNVCTDTKIRTHERDASAIASALPQILMEGLRLMVREQDPLFIGLDTAAPVSLVSFIQRYPKAILGIVAGRSYGDKLDKQIQQLQEQGRVYQLSAERGGIGAIDLLVNGKVNVILDFLVLTEHYLNQREDRITLHNLELAGEPVYANGHIYCSNSEFGQKLMQQVNQVMRKVVLERSYLDTHLSYISPARQPAFIRYYNQVYQTQF
jgi:uncharacterized protein (TIGR02285 family)